MRCSMNRYAEHKLVVDIAGGLWERGSLLMHVARSSLEYYFGFRTADCEGLDDLIHEEVPLLWRQLQGAHVLLDLLA